MVLLDSQLGGRGARDIRLLEEGGGPALQQQRAHLPVAPDGGPVQGRAALLVGGAPAGPQHQQQAHCVAVALVGRPMQRRPAPQV